MIVLIPSAKYVPESLWQIGKVPPIIYPLGQRTVFDYLHDQYKGVADEYRIICCEGTDDVHQVLEDIDDDVHLIDLPMLSSLADSVAAGLEGIDESQPVCLNFADTLVMDEKESLPQDSFFYSEDYQTDQWTYFECKNGKFIQITDKKASDQNDSTVKKLFVGVFFFSDGGFLRECMRHPTEDNGEGTSSFYRALRKYAERYPMTPVSSTRWFDIGHAEKYFNTRLEVGTRTFNEIEVDKHRGILTKESENKKKLCEEITWYLRLPKQLEYIHPRIYDYSIDSEKPYVKMEYYAYHTLHELFLYGELSLRQWREVFERVKFLCGDMQEYREEDAVLTREALEEIYLRKTASRLRSLKGDAGFKTFFEKTIIINGIRYCSLTDAWKKASKEIEKRLINRDYLTIIHGDLCFSNILIDPNYSFVKVIDPRGSFGNFDIYGDPRYEFAKLLHSVEGKYDFVIKDLFHCNVDADNAVIEYRLNERAGKTSGVEEMFFLVFQDMIGEETEAIRLAEALLFLAMIPLHQESREQQYVMLATGLKLLDRVCTIKENEAEND